jgi:hypothetical protein
MMRCALDDHFTLFEFPNDLAWWCWNALGDQVLAEHLGVMDPYRLESISVLRAQLLDEIEQRLWSLDRGPWCRPGLELHLMSSNLLTYDTGERITTPARLVEAIERISSRSLYYHVHEARRRSMGKIDDFSRWLAGVGVEADLVHKLQAIDFYFLDLTQLRHELLSALQQQLLPLAGAGGH